VTETENDLNKVRENSQARLKGICTANKVCDGAPQRLCQGQKYGGPIGFGGAGKGLAFTANVEALDRIHLKTRLVKAHAEPDMAANLFGNAIAVPIMASSLSGMKASMGGSISEVDFARSVLEGCRAAGTIGLIGNTADDGQELAGIEAVRAVGAGIPIFKPQSNERLIQLFEMAAEAGAVAVGVDIDGAGSTNWDRANKPVFRKSAEELNELVNSTKLPFIVKGIMSVEDAQDACDAGVRYMDVSNHGGRVLDSTRGVAEVLPEIAAAVGDRVTLTAGGGVRTGFDVLKMLALGAKAVLIGRDIARAAIGGGPQGVKLHLDYLGSDLRRAMLMTGCDNLAEITSQVLDA
jgi:isopentenyl diphosphate isomerase/L-lactate dehydrogenase-like FMN-dependent dehydrogenase